MGISYDIKNFKWVPKIFYEIKNSDIEEQYFLSEVNGNRKIRITERQYKRLSWTHISLQVDDIVVFKHEGIKYILKVSGIMQNGIFYTMPLEDGKQFAYFFPSLCRITIPIKKRGEYDRYLITIFPFQVKIIRS